MFYIFECYEAGDSYGKISVALADMEIVSPTGGLEPGNNFKALVKREVCGKCYLRKDTDSRWRSGKVIRCQKSSPYPAIISRKLFDAVQKEKCKRSRNRVVVR
ncbi:MAG: hypothetical protein HFF29_00395 [Oscillospiraceae bacterium]|nr:hypothetical protein [Oscillospiraceae bacterium]